MGAWPLLDPYNSSSSSSSGGGSWERAKKKGPPSVRAGLRASAETPHLLHDSQKRPDVKVRIGNQAALLFFKFYAKVLSTA